MQPDVGFIIEESFEILSIVTDKQIQFADQNSITSSASNSSELQPDIGFIIEENLEILSIVTDKQIQSAYQNSITSSASNSSELEVRKTNLNIFRHNNILIQQPSEEQLGDSFLEEDHSNDCSYHQKDDVSENHSQNSHTPSIGTIKNIPSLLLRTQLHQR